MPYKVIKRKCKQKSTGKSGTHAVVKKKSSGETNQKSCHTSEEKADGAVRARHANENLLRKYIKALLTEQKVLAAGDVFPICCKES